MSEQGYVYFVQGGDRVKIGWSRNVDLRVSQLRTAAADDLVLLGSMPGDRAEERAMQARFAALHIRGEWFRADAGLLAAIPWMCQSATDAVNFYDQRSRVLWSDAVDACVASVRRAEPGHGDGHAHREVLGALRAVQRFCWTFKWRGGRDSLDRSPGVLARWVKEKIEQRGESPDDGLTAGTLAALESLGGGSL